MFIGFTVTASVVTPRNPPLVGLEAGIIKGYVDKRGGPDDTSQPPDRIENVQSPKNFDIARRPFDVDKSTNDHYLDFIDKWRYKVGRKAVKGDGSHWVLPSDTDHDWWDVPLQSETVQLVLKVRKDNLYLDGYSAKTADGIECYQFMGVEDVYGGDEFHELAYDGSYGQLEKPPASLPGAGVDGRDSFILNKARMADAVISVATLPERIRKGNDRNAKDKQNLGKDMQKLQRSLIVIIEMVCEAIRFRKLSTDISANWYLESGSKASRPEYRRLLEQRRQQVNLETDWKKMSLQYHRNREMGTLDGTLNSQIAVILAAPPELADKAKFKGVTSESCTLSKRKRGICNSDKRPAKSPHQKQGLSEGFSFVTGLTWGILVAIVTCEARGHSVRLPMIHGGFNLGSLLIGPRPLQQNHVHLVVVPSKHVTLMDRIKKLPAMILSIGPTFMRLFDMSNVTAFRKSVKDLVESVKGIPEAVKSAVQDLSNAENLEAFKKSARDLGEGLRGIMVPVGGVMLVTTVESAKNLDAFARSLGDLAEAVGEIPGAMEDGYNDLRNSTFDIVRAFQHLPSQLAKAAGDFRNGYNQLLPVSSRRY
ncbi:hypothetical protein DCS_05832 [Drechmeria coniospora]|uniref:rRNA N-glycosylase n=1 Tax=Drechmeria coniospora TaxID=98403 RepID=A0A151GNX2_DRECN|nr:hypothetical protein DCS_05832 [Drechmeria coniospora]KYK58814.1 hypothetical protein DCS_05832 [Drechmeria coniospora]